MEEAGIPFEAERRFQPSGRTGNADKDKTGTLVKNCKESVQRESEVLVRADELTSMGKTDEHTRAMIMHGVKRHRQNQKMKRRQTERNNSTMRYEKR